MEEKISTRLQKPQRKTKYRSHFEQLVAEQLEAEGVAFVFEGKTLIYEAFHIKRKCIPDFYIMTTGALVEAKGLLRREDRMKWVLVKQANPDADIRFVFWKAQQSIESGDCWDGKAWPTYAEWAEAQGFLWAERKVPEEWIREWRT
jgi:hypothetical protein